MAIEFRSRVARAEAPKRALGAFLPDPCPCRPGPFATQPFHPEANRYMCRSYHTGRGHPACDAVLRHAPVASLGWHAPQHWSGPQLTSAFLPIKMAQDRLHIEPNQLEQALENLLYILHYAIILTFLAEFEMLSETIRLKLSVFFEPSYGPRQPLLEQLL